MKIVITIPDTEDKRVEEAYLKEYGYSPVLDDGKPNPLTPQEFVVCRIQESIRQVLRNQEIEVKAADVKRKAREAIDALEITCEVAGG